MPHEKVCLCYFFSLQSMVLLVSQKFQMISSVIVRNILVENFELQTGTIENSEWLCCQSVF